MKKITIVSISLFLYLLSCWITNEAKELAILSAYKRDHYTRYHLLYEKFVFFDEHRIIIYDRDIPSFDRIFILFLVVIFFVIKLIQFIPFKKRK